MAKAIWDLTIEFDESDNPSGPTPTGLKARSAKDVEEMAEAAGLALTTNYESPRNGSVRQLRVKEDENSPKLKTIIEEIEKRYSLVPATRMPVPAEDRDRKFGVRKRRTYTRKEIVSAELLCLYDLKRPIAEHAEGNAEQVANEIYVVEPGSVNPKVPIGFLSPFGRVAVSNDLKLKLEKSKLETLTFDPIVNGDGIWKLSSSITLPRCLLPLVRGDGQIVDEGDDPSGRVSWRYYDDEGYVPPELSFDRSEVTGLRAFDIANAAERVGDVPFRSNRLLIVSQHFRETLEAIKVRSVNFVPVNLVDGKSTSIDKSHT